MCFANITVEGANPDSEKLKTRNAGARRVCKDYGQVLEWYKAHRRTGAVREEGRSLTAMSNDGVGESESNRHTPAM
jgi:hypothetical protein